MTGLMKTETKPSEVVDGFDRIFEDWMQGPIALLLGRDDLHVCWPGL